MITTFQRRVYEALMEIPRGCVTTYGALATRIGCRSAQAVGQALRNNPFAPQVPCHRVISSNLMLGGYCGDRGRDAVARKLALLRSEGVDFVVGRLSDSSRLFLFP